jgi:simple sugar transport system ATP-binding protein
VSTGDPGGRRRVADIDLAVRSGEILGIAGVEGNGQDVLASAVVGLAPVRAGRLLLDGRDITHKSVRARQAAGLAHIPEDRLTQALVPDMSLRENLVLKAFDSRAFSGKGLLRWADIEAHATARMHAYDVRAPSARVAARQLSGGNLQKLVLARELSGSPRVVVAQNPVRGLDVGATRFVLEQLLTQRDRGAGVLLIHSDLDELLSVADRVAVMYDGACTMTDWPACDRAAIGRLMLGGTA